MVIISDADHPNVSAPSAIDALIRSREDLYGIQSHRFFSSQGDSSQQSSMNRNASYGDDLAGFSMEALQPAANGGAKLTKDQILAGFGQGMHVHTIL